MTLIVENGIVGTLLAGGMVILIGLQSWRLIRAAGPNAIWGVLISASLGAVLIDGMTFDAMMNWPNMVVFWLLAGALRAMIELQEKGSDAYLYPILGACHT